MRPMTLRAIVSTIVFLSALGLAACTSEGDESSTVTSSGGAPSATTVLPAPNPNPDPTSPSTTSSPGPVAPPPASVLPPVVTEPGSPAAAATCASLADALPISDLIPRDGDSWPDERQRVVVDARRNAALYAQAAGTAPPALSVPLVALGDFTTFVADTVQGAADAASARAAIDAYPAQGEVGAAASEVDRWRRTNCP